uniref:HTH CENPB-type domain-containing protein n=1 Tax=Haemonchus contortus TaxID=6289 RepID=A0A7I5E5Y2_HAECO
MTCVTVISTELFPFPSDAYFLYYLLKYYYYYCITPLERTMLGISLYTQVQKGIRSSEFRQRTKIRDAVDYAKKSKIRWARYSDDRWTRAVTDWIPRNIKRAPGRARGGLKTRWSEIFTEALN